MYKLAAYMTLLQNRGYEIQVGCVDSLRDDSDGPSQAHQDSTVTVTGKYTLIYVRTRMHRIYASRKT